ncbi:MAG: hypothetical protein II670_00805 [Alphaproteobacteria bacterium]|nr:hypothetical protein [Alphaproteobacteria bacterium]
MYEKDGVKYYSPNESFDYPKMDTKHIPIAKHTPNGYDYECPYCGALITSGFIESEVEYTDNGKTYPICCNETLGFNGWGDTHDWEEIHCCNKCHKEFIIKSGCY